MPQPDEKQDAGKPEQLAEGEQCEDHRQRMQPDPIADQPWDQHVIFEQLANSVHGDHGNEPGEAVPLQRRSDDAEQSFDWMISFLDRGFREVAAD